MLPTLRIEGAPGCTHLRRYEPVGLGNGEIGGSGMFRFSLTKCVMPNRPPRRSGLETWLDSRGVQAMSEVNPLPVTGVL